MKKALFCLLAVCSLTASAQEVDVQSTSITPQLGEDNVSVYQPETSIDCLYTDINPELISSGIVAPADSYDMTVVCKDLAIDGLSGAAVVKRVIAYNGLLYILALDKEITPSKTDVTVSEQSVPTIIVYDPAAKAVVANVSTTGAAGTFAAIADIQLTSDGYLIACNGTHTTYTASNYAYIYKWDNDENKLPTGDPVTWLKTQKSGNYTDALFYNFMYEGSSTAGTAVLAMRTAGATSGTYIGNTRAQVLTVSGDVSYTTNGSNAHYTQLGPDATAYPCSSDFSMFASPLTTNNLIAIDATQGVRDWVPANYLAKAPASTGNAGIKAAAHGHAGIFKFAGNSYIVMPAKSGVTLWDITNGLASTTQNTLNLSEKLGDVTVSLATAAAGEAFTSTGEDGITSGFNLYLIRDGKLTMLTYSTFTPSGLRSLAYDLSYETKDHLYYFTYSLSADAKSVVFKFTDPDDGSIKHEIQIADEYTYKGKHTVELDLNQLAKGKDYLWTVEVEAYPSGEYALIATSNQTTSTHGSVIPVTEPNSKWFGYTLTASGNNGQFILYNPALDIHSQDTPNRFGNIPGSPYRGTFHNGYAYVANNDKPTSGIYKVDLSDLGNVDLRFNGTRNTTTGVFTFTDNTTGSGRTSCVAFQGSGANTKLLTFDVFGEKVNCYSIGESDMITTAPTVITLSGVSWSNYNCDIITTEDGYFVSQSRAADGHSTSVPCFVYCDNANKVLYNSGDHKDIIPSCSSGIALNAQGDRFAVCRRNVGIIDVFQVTWTAGTPALTKLGEITAPESTWSQLRFDAAGNLHAYHGYASGSVSSSCYNVYSIVYPAATTTTCCPTKIAGGVSGVDIIQVGPAVDETPRFFNLQGVEVSADNLTPGIYIRVCNGTSTKVQVK